MNKDKPDEYKRKVYCPAPLPFFSFVNIVMIIGIIAITYYFLEMSKKKR